MTEFLKDFWCGFCFIGRSIGIPLGICVCLGLIIPYPWFVSIAMTIVVVLLLSLVGSDLR
jgi:hypothetical protein